MTEDNSMASPSARASRATPQAPAGLGQSATIPDERYMPGDGSWIDDRPAKARPKALEEWITL